MREREDREVILRGLIRLDRQHRQILRDVVAEDRTEYADVEATPETQAHDGLFGHAVGDAEARREGSERAILIQVQSDAWLPAISTSPVSMSTKPLAPASHGLRAVKFPAPAEVDGEVFVARHVSWPKKNHRFWRSSASSVLLT